MGIVSRTNMTLGAWAGTTGIQAFNGTNNQQHANQVVTAYLLHQGEQNKAQREMIVDFTLRLVPGLGSTLELADALHDGDPLAYASFVFSVAGDVATVATLGAAGAVRVGRSTKTLTEIANVANGISSVGNGGLGVVQTAKGAYEEGTVSTLRVGIALIGLWGAKADVQQFLKANKGASAVAKATDNVADALGDSTTIAGKKADDAFNDTAKVADEAVPKLTPTIQIGEMSSSCFAAGTPLLTPEGDKAIEDFRVGDLILTRNENDPHAPLETRSVEAVFERAGEVVELTIDGRTILTTAEHPFYVAGKGWVPTQQLEPGDQILSHNERSAAVEAVKLARQFRTVYNLRVTECHTYFVGSRSWGYALWAHNAYIKETRNGVVGVVDDTTGTFYTHDPATGLDFDDASAAKAAADWTQALVPPSTPKVIKNGHLAGKTHPVTGVPFDKDGYPIFESMGDAKLPTDLIGPQISDTKQFQEATRQLWNEIKDNPALKRRFTAEQLEQIKRGDAKIKDFTWHHHQDGTTIQLVDEWTHSKTGHSGGRQNTGGRP